MPLDWSLSEGGGSVAFAAALDLYHTWMQISSGVEGSRGWLDVYGSCWKRK